MKTVQSPVGEILFQVHRKMATFNQIHVSDIDYKIWVTALTGNGYEKLLFMLEHPKYSEYLENCLR